MSRRGSMASTRDDPPVCTVTCPKTDSRRTATAARPATERAMFRPNEVDRADTRWQNDGSASDRCRLRWRRHQQPDTTWQRTASTASLYHAARMQNRTCLRHTTCRYHDADGRGGRQRARQTIRCCGDDDDTDTVFPYHHLLRVPAPAQANDLRENDARNNRAVRETQRRSRSGC